MARLEGSMFAGATNELISLHTRMLRFSVNFPAIHDSRLLNFKYPTGARKVQQMAT